MQGFSRTLINLDYSLSEMMAPLLIKPPSKCTYDHAIHSRSQTKNSMMNPQKVRLNKI